MIEQTDQFNEHAHGDELANRDQADAQPAEGGAIIFVAFGLSGLVLALIVGIAQGWLTW